MSVLSRRLLVAFSLLGLGASSAATYVHYRLIQNPDYTSFCDINAAVTCKQAYLSRYGSMAGVPVAVGGVIFFAWVLLMLWGSRGKSRIKDSAPAYIFAASTVALAVVLYLAYASFFVLKEICPLCATTYVAVIGLFIVSGGASSVPMSSLPRRAMTDIGVLVGTPLALIIALVFVGGTAWGVSAFPHEMDRPAAQLPPAIADAERSNFEKWWAMQPQKPNFPYANDGAKVLIVEFADFECPHCRQNYFAYKPVFDSYIAAHPKDVKVLFKTYPLAQACNPAVPGTHFAASCEAAAAYVMAKAHGTADALKDWLFLHQDELTAETVKRAAKDVGKIPDYDAQYAKAVEQVKTDAALGAALGVNSTPTFFVNGKRIPEGGVPAQYLAPLIDIELKTAK